MHSEHDFATLREELRIWGERHYATQLADRSTTIEDHLQLMLIEVEKWLRRQATPVDADALRRYAKRVLCNSFMTPPRKIQRLSTTNHNQIGEPLARTPSPSTPAKRREVQAAIASAVNQLSLSRQRIVNGIYRDGKTQRQIAKELGVSPARISQRIPEILQKLRSFLGNDWQP